MSEIWLILSILSLALSIILVGVYVDQSRAEKQRAVRLLETQVVGPSGVAAPAPNLREETMKENFGSRVVVPVVSRAGKLARRVTPLDARDRISKKLLLAGSPAGWDAERILAFKIIGAVGGFILSIVLVPVRLAVAVPPDHRDGVADLRRVHRARLDAQRTGRGSEEGDPCAPCPTRSTC